MLTVEITKIPGARKTLDLQDGAVVQDAVNAAREAGLDVTGFELQIRSLPVQPTTRLQNGDLIVASQAIKGN